MFTITLKPGKEKSLKRRHPWVYAGAVGALQSSPRAGDIVRVHSHDQHFLGWGAFSPDSQIRLRMWSYDAADTVDAAFINTRIQRAILRRAPLHTRSNALRLIFGEADQLPGLIVDRYDQTLVVQFLATAVEAWREVIIDALCEHTGCTQVYERSDASVRQREGLPSRTGLLRGTLPSDVQIIEDGLRYRIDVLHGHKTGFYIDQRDNRALVARRVKQIGADARVLNCFSYTGGFSLAALAAGAAHVVSVDSSAEALAQGAENVMLNTLDATRATWLQQDVFDALKLFAADREPFDMIVLDPPKFASAQYHVERAARAYKEINLKAMKLLRPGGYLLTFSCSGAVNADLFQKIVAGAVIDSQRDMQLLQRLAAGEDHPMLMTHPEGDYLKGLLLQNVV